MIAALLMPLPGNYDAAPVVQCAKLGTTRLHRTWPRPIKALATEPNSQHSGSSCAETKRVAEEREAAARERKNAADKAAEERRGAAQQAAAAQAAPEDPLDASDGDTAVPTPAEAEVCSSSSSLQTRRSWS